MGFDVMDYSITSLVLYCILNLLVITKNKNNRKRKKNFIPIFQTEIHFQISIFYDDGWYLYACMERKIKKQLIVRTVINKLIN